MKWELHAHTSHSSHCGKVDAAEVARVYAAAGYTGIVITDHYNRENVECFPGAPAEQAREWIKGYEAVKAEGEKLGLKVLFGLEARLQDCDNDYLILGAEPEMVLAHPRLNFLTLEQLHALCGEYGALLVQAHPNRKMCRQADAAALDGGEGFNGNPRHDNRNDVTLAFAAEHPHLIVTSGSDFHQMMDLARGGVETNEKIETSADLARCLRERRFTRIEAKD